LRFLDLFSGIGGFSLGLESVGMETVAFCEMDKFCQKVLKKHWPDVPIHSDIKELDGYEYRGAVELVCGGFPCQPYSVAGEQRGSLDDRALWPEMLRVISEVQPTWVIGENVSGIINMELDNVLSDLEAQSYQSQCFVLPACAVDAKHRRDRVFIISYADRQGEPDEPTRSQERERFLANSGCKSEGIQGNGSSGERVYSSKKEQQSEKRNGSTDSSQIMANPDSKPIWGGRLHGESCNERWETSATGGESLQSQVGKAHIHQSESSGQDVAYSRGTRGEAGLSRQEPWEERNSGELDYNGHQQSRREEVCEWLTEPGVGRVADGVPNRTHRLRGLGNAVVPQLVAEIGRIVMYHHENNIDPRG
tara:strand:+ start:1751 stop:2842 length:1092 start_codon:yes stop_codon:yes gene_type:complete